MKYGHHAAGIKRAEDWRDEDKLSAEELIARYRDQQESTPRRPSRAPSQEEERQAFRDTVDEPGVGAGARGMTASAWQATQIEWARTQALEAEFKDPEFRNWYSSAPEEERNAFDARVLQMRQFYTRRALTGMDVEDELTRSGTPIPDSFREQGGFTRTDIDYLFTEPIGPRTRAAREAQGRPVTAEGEKDWRGQKPLSEVASRFMLPDTQTEVRRNLLRLVNTGTGFFGPQTDARGQPRRDRIPDTFRPEDRGQLKRQIRQQVQRTFVVHDPFANDARKTPAARGRAALIKNEEQNAIVKAIERSHFGYSPKEKFDMENQMARQLMEHRVRMGATPTREDQRKLQDLERQYDAFRRQRGSYSPEAVKERARYEAEDLIGNAAKKAGETYARRYDASELANLGQGAGDLYRLQQARDQAGIRPLEDAPSRLHGRAVEQYSDVVRIKNEPRPKTRSQRDQQRRRLKAAQGRLQATQERIKGLEQPRKAENAIKKLYHDLGREPTAEELANKLGIKPEGGESFDDAKERVLVDANDALRRSPYIGTVNWYRRTRPDVYQDPRFKGRFDPEVMYAASGHINPEVPFRTRLKNQYQFHKTQRQHQLEGWRTGEAAWARDTSGNIVPLTKRNARKVAYAVGPNTEWHYTLLNPEFESGIRQPPIKAVVEGYDLHTKFDQGQILRTIDQRDIAPFTGQLVEHPTEQGQWQVHWDDPKTGNSRTRNFTSRGDAEEHLQQVYEEDRNARTSRLIDVPPHKAKKQVDPVMFNPGRLTVQKEEPLPEGVAYREYVPIRGAKGETHTVNHPTEREFHYYRTDSYGRQTPITRAEYNALDSDYRGRELTPKKIQYVYQDPSKLKLADGEVDQLSIRVPGVTVKRVKKNDEEKILFRARDRLLYTNLGDPDTTRDKVVGRLVRTRDQRLLQERAIQAEQVKQQLGEAEARLAHLRDLGLDPQTLEHHTIVGHGFNESEFEMLLKAGAIAAGYKAQKAVREGVVQKSFEKGVGVLEKRKTYQKIKQKYNVPGLKTDIKEAWIDPGEASVRRKFYQVRHPGSSVSGETLGIDWGSPYYRQHGIKTETREARRFKRERQQLESIVEGERYLQEHKAHKGIQSLIPRWHSEKIERNVARKNFDISEEGGLESTLGTRIRTARAYRRYAGGVLPAGHRDNPLGEDISITPQVHRQAESFLHSVEKSGGIRERFHEASKAQPTFKGTSVDRVTTHHYSGADKAALIGGAAVATAVGAHYLYYKHQQKKLPEEERVAYYNKILPPSFGIPTPGIRTTAHWRTPSNRLTNEIPGASNRRIPVQWGLSVDKKQIAFRPMDRGYPKNAPVFGRVGIGSTARGGSFKRSLTTDLQRPPSKRFDAGTHNIFILGKKLPGEGTVGKQRRVELKRTNPNRMSKQQREDIVWATRGTDLEQDVKNFYSFGKRDPIIDMFNDPEEVDRILKRKGERERTRQYAAFYRQATGRRL